MSFADLLSGPKLYLICWFSYCKDWISPSPITVWLQVDLSAVSLFCLTEVIPLQLGSFCSPAFLPEVLWVTSTSIAVCQTLQESFMRVMLGATPIYALWSIFFKACYNVESTSFWCLSVWGSCFLAGCSCKKKCKSRLNRKVVFTGEGSGEGSGGHSFLGGGCRVDLPKNSPNSPAWLLSPRAHFSWPKEEQIFKGCLAVFTKILVATVQNDIITILAEWGLLFFPLRHDECGLIVGPYLNCHII